MLRFNYAAGGKTTIKRKTQVKKKSLNSIGRQIFQNSILMQMSFLNLQNKGLQMLRVKWIQKRNTLYFREPYFLQGGLPWQTY